MRITVERLRLWLLVGAGALLLVIAGFMGYARYRVHRLISRLPAQLGVDIKQSTNGFTYSQSIKGKTLFTIHAAKAVQRKDGKVTLHDVSILLHEGPASDRVDRISSSEFVYDQSAGVIQADGEVHIDLQAPGSKDADKGSVHVKTSGLVFMQKLGVAATENPIEFEAKGISGRAKGADYSTDTGALILHAAVEASTQVRGKRTVLTASWAQLDRESQLVRLRQPHVERSGEVADAARAIVHLRRDGTVERLETEGGLKATSADGGLITSEKLETKLDAASQPEWARLTGSVQFEQKDNLRRAQGNAAEVVMEFPPGGVARTGRLTGGAHVTEVDSKRALSRDLRAETVDLRFAGDKQETVLRQAEARGSAHLVTIAAKSRSEFTGDHMLADFAAGERTPRVTAVHGDGHVRMERSFIQGTAQSASQGTRQASTAERMDLRFKQDEVESGLLTGSVLLTQTSAGQTGVGKPSRELRATGDRAEMRSDGMVELTGSPRVMDGLMTVEAVSIRVQRDSRQAWANGAVKASYARSGDPVHVVAENAEWRPAEEIAIFRGVNRAARMWQSQSQVEAPSITLDRARQRATAGGGVVRAVLAGKGSGAASRPGTPARETVYRISASEMRYDEASRQMDFAGPVRVDSADGRLTAHAATVMMLAAKEKGAAEFGGTVERVLAKGDVTIDQGERHGTGDQLVYTAADGLAVLTGTASVPPKVVDPRQGTVSGAALSFHAGDDSVVISGTGDRRVRAGTQVKP